MFRLLRAACGAAVHLLAIFLKIVYNILKLFRVRLLALYLAVCGLLHLCFHSFAGMGIAYFWVGFAVCCLVTLYGYAGGASERLRRKNALERECCSCEEPAQEEAQCKAAQPPYPLWFAVEGREDFAFAEYRDRYELFRRDGEQWIYVRTDYKKEEKT